VLHRGIETVLIYAKGQPHPTFTAALRAARQRQHLPYEERGEGASEYISIGGDLFELDVVGRRNTPFILRSDKGITVSVSPLSPARRQSFVMLRLGSTICTGVTPDELLKVAKPIIDDCLAEVRHVHVTEIDIHADWTGWHPPSDPELWTQRGGPMIEYGIARNRKREFTGLTLGYKDNGEGARGNVALRIENKTREIDLHSGKGWLLNLYRQADPDFDPTTATVYRAELRLKRNALRGMKTPSGLPIDEETQDPFESVRRVLEVVPAIWRKLLSSTCRLTVRGSSKQRCRWKTDPAWEVITNAFGAGPCVTRAQVKVAQELSAADTRAAFCRGCIGALDRVTSDARSRFRKQGAAIQQRIRVCAQLPLALGWLHREQRCTRKVLDIESSFSLHNLRLGERAATAGEWADCQANLLLL